MFLRKALCKPAVDVTSPSLNLIPDNTCTDNPDTQTRPVPTARPQGEMCKLGNLRPGVEPEVKLTRGESVDKESHKSGRPMLATFAAMFRPTDSTQLSTNQGESSTEAAQKSIPSSQSRPTNNEDQHQPALLTLASKFWNSASVSNRDLNLIAPVSS